jgi:hypothetical protein
MQEDIAYLSQLSDIDADEEALCEEFNNYKTGTK